ncbi:uncharacterized protein BHQ10_003907 [Talaromyces amestolkiae]|uniref:Uncharacterized protein n=1 Tax=Talaromyces amestolkiae TaxID=1196081 RepID=A0A364KWG3_TALAM|nr:uncharacterized protein BHQ10_003907 [Talaromyces amestolkiae]RAO67895.1 hypothetical protein BHQ10_003907 [Talaromyces amestolkiae]
MPRSYSKLTIKIDELLEKDSARLFAVIKTHAVNIKQLTLAPTRKDFVKLQHEDAEIVVKKPSALRAHLDAIPFLEVVLVEVYWQNSRQILLDPIENYGMKVKMVKKPFGA